VIKILRIVLLALAASPAITFLTTMFMIYSGSDIMVDPAKFSWFGGEIYSHRANISKMQENNETIILDQTCYSACTMYLKVAECVDPGVDFYFHAPRKAKDSKVPELYVTKLFAVYTLKSHYSDSLAEWFEKVWRDTQEDQWAILSGKDLVKSHGYKSCG